MNEYRYEIDGITIESAIEMTDAELLALVDEIRAMRAAGASARPASGQEATDVAERFGGHGMHSASDPS